MFIITIKKIENSVEYTTTCINMPPPRYTYVYNDGSEYQDEQLDIENENWMEEVLTELIERNSNR